uniref:Uncharacterized protein n=1 Tax=Anguilla anguilla TaxID=7936 RepID=A0A0E9QWB8_ANGAN
MRVILSEQEGLYVARR